jgi:hypothetical protein
MFNIINLKLYFHKKEKYHLSKIENLTTSLPVDLNINPCYIATTDNYIYKNKKYFCECFYFLYTYNTGIGCFHLFPNSSKMGYHKYDCEKVCILYNYDNYKNNIITPEYVYFSQHGSKQGEWLRWEDCDTHNYNNKLTLNIYVARGSHAIYPKPKITFRIFGFGNDNTMKDEKYAKYIDTIYEAVNLTTPIRMSSIVKIESEKVMTSLERFLIPFSL